MQEDSPLKNPIFQRLFLAQVTSLSGTGVATIALALLAFDLAGADAGEVLGTALAIKMVAYVFVAPIAGAIFHRLPRRELLILLDLSRALVIGALPFVDQIWQVYLLIFLLNACSAAFTPTFQSVVPDVVPDDKQYTRAVAYSRLAYDIENLASPTLAAAMLLFLSYDALFFLNSLTFVVSALFLMSSKLPVSRVAVVTESVWSNTTSGVLQYLRTPRLRGLLALSLVVACAGAMVIVNTVVYVQGDLELREQATAIVMMAFGCGSIVVALTLPGLLDARPDRPFMFLGGALLVSGLFAGLLQPGFFALLIVWFVLGMGSSLAQTPSGRLLKRSSNDTNRTQIYAAQFALSHLCWLIAYPLAGWLGSLLGLNETFLILGVLALVALLLSVSIWPAQDDTVLPHTHEAMSHEHLHVHDEHHQHEHEGWEGVEPHKHPHRHAPLTHSHAFVVDMHHEFWPR
jgi:predicted MFS family arabinose efflux permease